MTKATRPIALTMGEPAGIGPDITLGCWHAREEEMVPHFVLFADADVLVARAAQLGQNVPIRIVETPAEGAAVFDEALPVIPVPVAAPTEAGIIAPENQAAVIRAMELAVLSVTDGACSAVVTNPIQKKAVYDEGFSFPGQTEFLADLAGGMRPVMMLMSSELMVVPVTIHLPIRDVPSALTQDLIVETAEIVLREAVTSLGIVKPRLAVAGLNPHAGEDGTIGREEIEVIEPALKRLRQAGHTVFGPLPADTLFHEHARETYDVCLAMYHDQALIPIKTLAFDRGVNVTLGLPFVRTSPDHGTALSIAGTGHALHWSLVEALLFAADIARNRELAA